MARKHEAFRDLKSEARSAQELLAVLASFTDDAEGESTQNGLDAETIDSVVESETYLFEVVEAVLDRIDDLSALIEGIKKKKIMLDARAAAMAERQEDLRRRIYDAVSPHEALKPLRLPDATISMRASAQRLNLVDESLIPEEFIVRKTEVVHTQRTDRAKVLDALKNGREVPGATLDNAPPTIAIRRKV